MLLVPCLVSGDAVGHDVAGMFAVLREKRVQTYVVAEHWDQHVTMPVEPLSRYVRYAQQRDILSIYHHSTAWEEGHRQFLASTGPKVMRYHNITPSAFFAPYSPPLATEVCRGRQETEVLVRSGCIDLFIGASRYNLQELHAIGAPATRCHSLPPFHALDDLASVPASLPILEKYLDGTYNMLFIGRVSPNKGHRHLLGVVGAFCRLFSRSIRLFVAGGLDPRFHAYQDELRTLAHGLRVADKVVWTGTVGPGELKAYLLLAHAFLVMSEHEGFCVPVVEAMAHNVPVVAYASGAVPETMGDAGILLHGLDYDHYAAALELLFSRTDLRDAVIARQRDRVTERFAAPVLAKQFWSLISPFLSH